MISIQELDPRPTIHDRILAKQEETLSALSTNRRVMPYEGENSSAAV